MRVADSPSRSTATLILRLCAHVDRMRPGTPGKSVSAVEADTMLGFLGQRAQAHNPAFSARTQPLLGFAPEHVGLLENLPQPYYFARDDA